MREWTLRLAIGIAFLFLAVLMALAPVSNNDIWLHLKTGERILQRAELPRGDEYTYTRAGAPYIEHEWLAQVLLALLYRQAGGLGPISVAYAALGAALLGLVYRGCLLAARSGAPGADEWARPVAALVTLAAFVMMTTFLAARPHMFTFLFTALFTLLLPRLDSPSTSRRERALVMMSMGLTQVLWANLHGGFIAGILLVAIHAVGGWIRRRRTWLAPLTVALAALCCVNPYGWRIYAVGWKLADPLFRRFIVEWESPFDARYAATPQVVVYLTWMAVATAAAIGTLLKRREATPLLVVAVFGALSATSRRHMALLAIATAPLVARGVAAVAAASRRRRLAPLTGWTVVIVIMVTGAAIARKELWVGGVSPRPGLIAPNIPVESVEVMRAGQLRGRVFTTLDLASYVTWRAWPGLTTSIDSRLELFGGAFIAEHLIAERDPHRFEQLVAAEPCDFVLLPWRRVSSQGAIESLRSSPAWALVYFDDLVVLYARRCPENDALIERRAYRAIDPVGFVIRGGFDPGADRAEILQEAARAAAEPPARPDRAPVNRLAAEMIASATGAHPPI